MGSRVSVNVVEAVMPVKRQLSAAVASADTTVGYWYNVRVGYDEELVVGSIPEFKLS